MNKLLKDLYDCFYIPPELTPAVLHDLVNKVYVCAPDKSSGHRVQDVRISLTCIGFLSESIIAEMVNRAAERRTA